MLRYSLILVGLLIALFSITIVDWFTVTDALGSYWTTSMAGGIISLIIFTVGIYLIWTGLINCEYDESGLVFTPLVISVFVFCIMGVAAQSHLAAGGTEWWVLFRLL